nr:methyl-accepting chemotaxis protein [Pseudoteredinibacter isoporae]
MRDLHSSVEQGLHRSEESYKAAQNGSKAVENGAEQVRQTAGSVVRLAQDIEVSSQQLSELRSTGDQVSSVVGTIAEIAEQTNLLALNAAIEAARAGESGRGFAVVADEVRTLANRTQQSTEEINNMLTALVNAISGVVHSMENNSKQAEQSAQMAQQTVSTLNQIQETILDLSESSRVVAELNTGASENASRIQGQVEEFSTLGSAVQQGSAETKQTASDLSCSVSRLNELVGRFTL